MGLFLKSRGRRKISTKVGLASLLACIVASVLILDYAAKMTSAVTQTIALLVSMGLLFYSSHPLGHYFAARVLGVSVDYFFLGRSDFRKLAMKTARTLGNILPTVGTKLNGSKLKLLPPRGRGYILGSGAIVSTVLIGIQLVYAFITGFGPVALLFGAIFFVGNLGLELLFSTKVGDLSKMTNVNRQVSAETGRAELQKKRAPLQLTLIRSSTRVR